MTIGVQAMLEFLCILVYCAVLSAIYIAAPTGFPPAAATDCRLAQLVTPETVYSPTLAGRRSKPRNLILCLARAGIDLTTSSTVVQRLTVVPTRQAYGQDWLAKSAYNTTIHKKLKVCKGMTRLHRDLDHYRIIEDLASSSLP